MENSKTKQTISVRVELSIEKPIQEVFKAALDPKPFFVKNTSGPMREGAEITWEFQEVPKAFPIQVKQVAIDQRILFMWSRGEATELNAVGFTFKPFDLKTTTVVISESGWPAEEKEREASYRNCMGWMHMLCSLKAYLEYGVNLRKGAFVHMKFD